MAPIFRQIAPAPPKVPEERRPTGFFDLPGELRNYIYQDVLLGVVVHILPLKADDSRKAQHPLTMVNKQFRMEVLPLLWALCPIDCPVTDFNFDGILAWLDRIPPAQRTNLCSNKDLVITLNTSTPSPPKKIDSLRKWLHYRADPCHSHANWVYRGPTPPPRICSDLRRRCIRMPEAAKQREFNVILKALDVSIETKPYTNRGRKARDRVSSAENDAASAAGNDPGSSAEDNPAPVVQNDPASPAENNGARPMENRPDSPLNGPISATTSRTASKADVPVSVAIGGSNSRAH